LIRNFTAEGIFINLGSIKPVPSELNMFIMFDPDEGLSAAVDKGMFLLKQSSEKTKTFASVAIQMRRNDYVLNLVM
jgi:hypothetical protein